MALRKVPDREFTLTLHAEEWEYILAACEEMSCVYERSDPIAHCCDLNEMVPKIRRMMGIPTTDDSDDYFEK